MVQRAAMNQWVVVVNVCSEAPTEGVLSDFAAEHVERWRSSVSDARDSGPTSETRSEVEPSDGDVAGPDDILALAANTNDPLSLAAGTADPFTLAASIDDPLTLAASLVETRHVEDVTAMKRLGADWVNLGLTDAIFRRVVGPLHPYRTVKTLFGPIDPREADLVKLMTLRLANLPAVGPETRVLTPLGIGGHVDHRLTRAAAEAWRDLAGIALAYYEDLPYAAELAARSQAAADPAVAGLTAGNAPPLVSHLVPMSAMDLEAKIEAMAAYRSQITTFWSSEDEMADDVRRWADAHAVDPSLPAGILGEWRHAAAAVNPETTIT